MDQYGDDPSTPRIAGQVGEQEATMPAECEKNDAIQVPSRKVDECKSTAWSELKTEPDFNPWKVVLIFLFILFVLLSFIFCALALKYGPKQNAVVPPLDVVNHASPFPTTAPAAHHLRNTAPTGAPSRNMQLFSPTLYAPTLDPNGCPRRPTPPPLPGKKGVAFTLRPEGQKGSWVENLPKVQALNAYWNYNWGSYRIDAQPTNMEFAPMIWGPWNVPTFLQNDIAPQIRDKKAQRILGFNEPDKEKQANMSVEQAIEFWPSLESMGLSLVSPSCADPMGTWMEEFMDRAIELCYRVDWIGVHWYGGPNVNTFKTRMIGIYEKYQKPLLITEFAPADWEATTVQNNRHSSDTVLSFAKEVIPWLEEQPWVMGYAWFSFNISQPEGTSSAFFNTDGSLTPLGRYYTSVRT